jgi:dihydroorotate dehydrogenase (fumarate)
MDLSTNYMGLALRNPLVASPSPLSYTLDGIRQLAGGGVGAIVLFSLFEEQLREQAARAVRLVEDTAESFPEALNYFPSVAEDDGDPRAYLYLLERAVAIADIPIIASLNGVTLEGWTDYARGMQSAGAAAIELNIYYLPGSPEISGRDVEQRHVDVLERVKSAVTVPVAVKLSPFFSSPGEMALRLNQAGADALVLFNRFLQPDIDPEQLVVLPRVNLSSPADARLARTWIALLRGRVSASLAATSGVEVPADVARYLLAGADVVMTTSALLRHGAAYAGELLDGLSSWMARKGFTALDEVRGLLSVPAETDESAYEPTLHGEPRRVSVAAVVLERNCQPDAESRHGAVLDRHVLSQHLCDPQVADRPCRCLHRITSGGLPRLTAHADHFGDAVNAVGHHVLLLVDDCWTHATAPPPCGSKNRIGAAPSLVLAA